MTRLREKIPRNFGTLLILLLPTCLILVSVYIYPLFHALKMSFYRWSIVKTWLGQTFVGLGNYIHAITTDPGFHGAVANTLFIGVVAISLEMVLGISIALLTSGGFVGKQLFRNLLFIPVILTPVGIGATWKLMLNTDVGPIPYIIAQVTGTEIAILSEPWLAKIAVILSDVWQTTPFVFVMILAALETLPRDPHEAARIDGANTWQIIRYVTLPLLKPVIVVILLIRIMELFRIFGKVYILTGGGPGGATEVISTYIVRNMFQYFESGYSSALSILVLLLVTFITLTYYRLTKAVG